MRLKSDLATSLFEAFDGSSPTLNVRDQFAGSSQPQTTSKAIPTHIPRGQLKLEVLQMEAGTANLPNLNQRPCFRVENYCALRRTFRLHRTIACLSNSKYRRYDKDGGCRLLTSQHVA